MSPSPEAVKQFVLDKAAETINTKINAKLNAKINKQAEKVAAKSAKHIEGLDRLAQHLETIDVWMRSEKVGRKPRFHRADIAAAAIRIADAEGFEAVSMRRLAAELDAGTMTLYHYVRTKDELLTLIVDAVLAEVILPPGHRFPKDWRVGITSIARRSLDALRRHPWMLDIADDPNIGPNAMRHFDQSWQALASLEAGFDDKLDLIATVDEYVFGFSLHERNNLEDDVDSGEMIQYIGELLSEQEYPALSSLVDELGLEQVWSKVHRHARGAGRFDRNLARLLSGFEASLASRKA